MSVSGLEEFFKVWQKQLTHWDVMLILSANHSYIQGWHVWENMTLAFNANELTFTSGARGAAVITASKAAKEPSHASGDF